MPLPTERAASGSRLGPRTIRAITRITISSSGPGVEITRVRLADARAGVVEGGAEGRIERLDLGVAEPALLRDLVDHHAPGRPRRAVRAEPGRVPAVGVAARLPLVRVQARDALRVAGEVEHPLRRPRGALLVVLRVAARH